MNYSGNDVTKKQVPVIILIPSWPDCAKWCAGMVDSGVDCKFWTYHKTSMTCFAKTSDSGKTKAVGYISGPVTCTGAGKFF